MTSIHERIAIIEESSWARDNPLLAKNLITEIQQEAVSPIVVKTSSVRDDVQSIVDIPNMTHASHLQSSHSV